MVRVTTRTAHDHHRCRTGWCLGQARNRMGADTMNRPLSPTFEISSGVFRPDTHATQEGPPVTGQRMLIVAAVMLAHVGSLWALHSGLLHRAVEVVIPVAVVADVVETAAPQPVTQQPASPTTPAQAVTPHRSTPQPPLAQPSPSPALPTQPSPAASTTPSDGPTAAAAPAPSSAVPASTPSSSPVATPSPAAPPKIELPSTKADYLNNPAPAYPSASKRMGEQGLVIVRTLIGTDGTAQRAEVRTSSGFERLDKVAVETVLQWRYVPGKRNGEPEAMWFDVPIHFQLK